MPPTQLYFIIQILVMITIALAEDHLKMRGYISSAINKINSYCVSFEAVNGFQLISQLQASKTIPEIAVIDVHMPVMDGLALTHFLSRHYPDIKVLAVSTYTHVSIVQDMLEAGAKGYLTKEDIADSLPEALSVICSGKVFIDERIKDKEALPRAVRSNNVTNNIAEVEITEKENLFLQLSATAISYEQIAQLMNVASNSVYNYQKSLKDKLGLGTRQEFMMFAIQHGIAKVARLNDYSPYK